MSHEAPDVTEAELNLMQVLWDRGRSSLRQITDLLYPGGGPAQYATVQKLMERLESKGFVHRDRTLFVHTFTAAVDRDELIGRRLRAVADKLCGGSMVPILSHLMRNQALSPAERNALRELVEEPDVTESSEASRKGRKTRKG